MASAISNLSPLGAVTKHFSKIMCVLLDRKAVLGVIILKLASRVAPVIDVEKEL